MLQTFYARNWVNHSKDISLFYYHFGLNPEIKLRYIHREENPYNENVVLFYFIFAKVNKWLMCVLICARKLKYDIEWRFRVPIM